MWNSFKTDSPPAVIAEPTTLSSKGDQIHAYVARPADNGRHAGIVLIHHMPGWDEFYLETARRFATHGYSVICPDLYCRFGHATPDDVAAKVRADGGVPDETVMADCEAALKELKSQPTSNGKVGVIGTCSGGRHAYLVGCRVPGFDAVGNLWGGRVVAKPEDLTPRQPKAPVEFTSELKPPVLGLFGNDDQSPSPDQVNTLEAELKRHSKAYEFHRYDGAGHGFFYYHAPAYRQQQAMDGWHKVFAFFDKNLNGA
ncbi:MAG TPA: dienelactone hydrolase family protein [Chloroflexota bacterium]|nr:dienelactone hydrolase family protein [Chloroflexota bacterium]